MRLETDEITLRNAQGLAAAGCAAIAAGDAVIDCSGVARCDTAAVACVLAWQRAARAAGRTLQILAPPPGLASLARLYGVEDLVG